MLFVEKIFATQWVLDLEAVPSILPDMLLFKTAWICLHNGSKLKIRPSAQSFFYPDPTKHICQSFYYALLGK